MFDKLAMETKIIIIGVALVLVLIALAILNKKEKFTEYLTPVVPIPQPAVKPAVKPVVNAIELKQPPIPIRPAFYDAGSGVVMAGSEFTPKELLSPWYQTFTGKIPNHFILDDGAEGAKGLHFNMCSKACCSEQWPLPFKMPHEERVCNNKDKFVPSPYFCNNAWQDSGCVCMTKDQSDFIGGRGKNAF